MVLPFKPAGTIHPADEAETLLGSRTEHSCCWSKCWAAGTQGSLCQWSLGNESRFWTLLVSFILRGRVQVQHLECFDRCPLWLHSKVDLYNDFHTFGPVQCIQGFDAPQCLLLPGCSPLVYYRMSLYRALQTKHRRSLEKWVENAGPLYLCKKSRPTSSSLITSVPLPVESPHPSCARHHVQKLKASIRNTAKQTHTQTSLCQEADNVFFSISSMAFRSNWLCFYEALLFFLIFNTANPAWSVLNYFHTCWDSSAGHSSKVWALRRERR